MAFNPVTLTGQVKDATGSFSTASGHIWFELSQAGNCTSGGFAVGPSLAVVYHLTNGVIDAAPSPVIAANDDITPSGTYYRETVIDDNGTIVVRRNVTITGPGTVKDIGTLPVPQLPSGSASTITLPLDITQGGTSSNSARALRTAAAR